MEQAILEQLQQLPEAAQAEALRYIEGLVAQHTAAEPMSHICYPIGQFPTHSQKTPSWHDERHFCIAVARKF
jgi:hypothetical protein